MKACLMGTKPPVIDREIPEVLCSHMNSLHFKKRKRQVSVLKLNDTVIDVVVFDLFNSSRLEPPTKLGRYALRSSRVKQLLSID